MKRNRIHLIILVVLALFVGMGMVVSAVQTNDMAIKMAAASDSGSFDMNGCTACGGGDGNAKPVNCLPACVTTAFAILPATTLVAINVTVSPPISLHAAPRELTGIPDPSPPRLSILG